MAKFTCVTCNKFDLAKIRAKVGRKKEAPKTHVFPKPRISTTNRGFIANSAFFEVWKVKVIQLYDNQILGYVIQDLPGL